MAAAPYPAYKTESVGRVSEAPPGNKHKELKRHSGRFSFFPVFVFLSIPLVHGRVSPDISTPRVELVEEVPVCTDTLILCPAVVFATGDDEILAEFFS